ncbi:hypothetical protein ACWDNU_46375, partial [Amycolatopsis sp. NPDC003676]
HPHRTTRLPASGPTGLGQTRRPGGAGPAPRVPASTFWDAEPEHQDYLIRYPDGYTCHFPRPGWKLPKRATAEQ